MAYIPWYNRTGPITLGERFGLNEISTRAKPLSPTKSYAEKPTYNWEEGNWWDLEDESVGGTKILEDFEITDEMRRRPNVDGGRIALGDGSITEVTKGPNTGKYHLRLGKDKTVHYGTKAQLEKIHKQWKITNPPGTNLYKAIRKNPKLLKKIIADIPKMSNSAIQKKYKISGPTLWEIMKDNPKLEFGKQEFNPWTSPKDDVRRLKPELTKRLNLIQSIIKNTEIPMGQIKADDKIIKVLADKVGVSTEEFLRNLSQLKQEHGNPTGRIKILQSVKKDLSRFPDPKFIREHLRVVGLTDAVPTLDSVERAARKIANSRTNLEHSLPRNLIKFFDLPKEYLLKGERTSNFLNQFKKQFDNKMLLAAKEHAKGDISYSEYMKKVNDIRNTVRNATGGYEIGYIDFKDGKPVAVTSQESFLKANKPLGPKNTGVFNFLKNSVYHNNLYNNWAKDKNNKIYSTLNDEIKKMEAKNIRFLPEKELANSFNQLKNIKSKKDLFKLYKINPNNALFKAMATAANMKGNAGIKIGTGVATFALLSSAANAAEPGEKEIVEASVLPAVIKDHPYLSSAAAVTAAAPKKTWEAVKWGTKKLTPLLTPAASHVLHGGKYDLTSGTDLMAPAFWKHGIDAMNARSRWGNQMIGLKKRLRDIALRGGLPTRFLPLISGTASAAMGPMLIKDAAEWLQGRIDKEGITGLIADQSGIISDEAGGSLFMEDVIEEKKRRDSEGMDYATGGIASLIK
jgi:hypothetical protein